MALGPAAEPRPRKLGGRRRSSVELLSSWLMALCSSAHFMAVCGAMAAIMLFVGHVQHSVVMKSRDDPDGELISKTQRKEIEEEPKELWPPPDSQGWRPATVPRTDQWLPPRHPSSGYLMVRCNGGLNQQRTAICNAVLAARVMNATLVLPHLDTNLYWKDESDFASIYDVRHFIEALKGDVEVVKAVPKEIASKYRRQVINPPRDAPIEWYTGPALKALRKHKLLYLTPFSHRVTEDVGDSPEAAEWQRLRCRVNFQALRFQANVESVAKLIVGRLREDGPFLAVHLRFEMDMLAYAGCVDIFTEEERAILMDYRKSNFAEKRLDSAERRRMGKCPLTPEEVGLILQAMGYPNNTRIYLAAGEIFGGDRFMAPLYKMFPFLTNRSSVANSDELSGVSVEGHGLLGSAVDYVVCLKADIFFPTYDGPSNFDNNVMGHRLFNSFGVTVRPNRKALARVFDRRQRGLLEPKEFNRQVNVIMRNESRGGPRPRQPQESFYTNPWPECFCQAEDRCAASKGREREGKLGASSENEEGRSKERTEVRFKETEVEGSDDKEEERSKLLVESLKEREGERSIGREEEKLNEKEGARFNTGEEERLKKIATEKLAGSEKEKLTGLEEQRSNRREEVKSNLKEREGLYEKEEGRTRGIEEERLSRRDEERWKVREEKLKKREERSKRRKRKVKKRRQKEEGD